MLSLAVALLAAATPLKIRVLERDRPYEAWLAASTLTCDGAALGSTVALHLKDRRLEAGDKLCDVVEASGNVKVTPSGNRDAAPTRRYPGKLTAVAEGALIRFINEVEIEDYLPGVVAAETVDFPPAALESQAVVSRTFALASRGRHKEHGYDLCDLAHCQIYRGSDEIPASVDDAVKRTRGEVLLLGGVGLKPAYFHAACGGHTSRTSDVFGELTEGVGPGVSDTGKDGPLCKESPDFKWTFDVERVDLARALGVDGVGAALEPLRRDEAGRVIELKTFGHRLRGNEFMSAMGKAFGWSAIKSMKVNAEEIEGTVHFSGSGIGHGVGLCQAGAKAMASKGATRKQILQKYFPDCQVRVP
jgi:stage II sporulation protein D